MSRHIGFGFEATATYGTAGTVTDFVDGISETMQVTRNFEKIGTINAHSTRTINYLNSSVGGDIVVLGNMETCGILFKAMHGGSDVSGGSPYTHTFPPAAGIPASGRTGYSLTTEVKRDTTALTSRYLGCRVVSYGMQATLDQSPRLTWGLVGKSETVGAVTSESVPTFTPMLIPNMTATVDGAAIDATSISVNMSWPVDTPYKIGSSTFAVEPIDSDVMDVTFEITGYMADAVEYNKFDGTDFMPVVVAVTSGAYSITHTISQALITAAPWNIDQKSRVLLTLSGMAKYNTAATESMQTVLINEDVTIPSPA